MMRRRYICSIILVLSLINAPSLFSDPLLKINLEPSLGFLCGEAREIVYDNGYILSELVWPMAPLAYSGMTLAMRGGTGFAASFGLKTGLPSHVGTITDSDYLNGDGIKTHFSAHECYAERAIVFDAKAGWAFNIVPRLEGNLMAAFSLMNFKWSAKDGYFQFPPESSAPYTPWSSSTSKTTVYGTGIIYEQTYFVPGIFLNIDWSISRSTQMKAGFLYSPAVVCNDVDNHEFKGADYYEKMSGGSLVEPSLILEWHPAPQSSLGLHIGYRLIWSLMGSATIIYTTSSPYLSGYSPGATYTFTNGGGASYSVMDVSLTYSAWL